MPTIVPSSSPAFSMAPSPRDKDSSSYLYTEEPWYNSLDFKIATTLGIPAITFITGWFLREKDSFLCYK